MRKHSAQQKDQMLKRMIPVLAIASCCIATHTQAAAYANSVVSYAPGTGFATDFSTGAGLTNAASALGEPSRITPGAFGGPVDPFNPPYLAPEIVSIGAGGSLTIALSAPALNDLNHPYGLDFDIYGNTGFDITNGNYTGGGVTDGTLFGASTGTTRVYSATIIKRFISWTQNVLRRSMHSSLRTARALSTSPSTRRCREPILPGGPRQDSGALRWLSGRGGVRLVLGTGCKRATSQFGRSSFCSRGRADRRSGDRRNCVGGRGAGAGPMGADWDGRDGDNVGASFSRVAVKAPPVITVLVLCALAALPLLGAELNEDFSSDPTERGWKVTGDAGLFAWDSAAQNLQVTWDSSRTNSYFWHALGTVIGRTDDVELAFDLQLQDVTVGITPGQPFTFELAIGLLNLQSVTSTNFVRGTGLNLANVMEFDYFPDSGFGATISPTIVSSNGQFATSFTFPLALDPGALFHVQLNYAATDQTLTTTVRRNGEPYGSIKMVTLPNRSRTSGSIQWRSRATATAGRTDQSAPTGASTTCPCTRPTRQSSVWNCKGTGRGGRSCLPGESAGATSWNEPWIGRSGNPSEPRSLARASRKRSRTAQGRSALARSTGCERCGHEASAPRFHTHRAPGCDRAHCCVVFVVAAQFRPGAELRTPGDVLFKPAPNGPGRTNYWDDSSGNAFRWRGASTNNGQIYWFGWLENGTEGQRRFDPTCGALYPYLGARGIETCPAFNSLSSGVKLKAVGASCGYGYNLALSASEELPPVNIGKVSHPAGLIFLGDAAQVNTFQAPASADHPMLEEFYYLNTTEATAHFRHNGRGDAAFCDGHAGSERPAPGSLDTRLAREIIGRFPSELLMP